MLSTTELTTHSALMLFPNEVHSKDSSSFSESLVLEIF